MSIHLKPLICGLFLVELGCGSPASSGSLACALRSQGPPLLLLSWAGSLLRCSFDFTLRSVAAVGTPRVVGSYSCLCLLPEGSSLLPHWLLLSCSCSPR
ncbi:hypothetical protein LXA43DRAFT_978794 [Ganoderma leucocontextum]|nr:hypothetical protein LXA43DRAFT_978794 [Ganoderma leucocontextum]